MIVQATTPEQFRIAPQYHGMQTLEEILDVCAMPGTEALDLILLIVTSAQLGVIELD